MFLIECIEILIKYSHKYNVNTKFVKAIFDINCSWEWIQPAYRVYVNDELFTERTWIWTDFYLEETLQIQAPPGKYQVRLEPVTPNLAKFEVSNFRIEYGNARWISEIGRAHV